ncbi:Pollen Ole e 1 allergen and extensin family protein [Euphorbia peplus]|nr:Pollen Ole e 1 allergen and extensin family protein [Euphorbia peplus]
MTSSWFLLLFLCLLIISNVIQVSNARHHHNNNLPSAVVVGTVYCDTCFHQEFSKNSHFIPGASVEVECKDETSKPSFRQRVKTNEKGEFRVHLPFSVGKHVKRIKKCSVKLLNSSEPYCAVASTATSSLLRLKSRKEGIHIFSAGFFTFKPEKQPILCNEKPRIPQNPSQTPSKISDNLTPFPPPLQDPVENNFFLPPLPTLPPLPQLPPLPPLPGIPFLPPATGLPPLPLPPPVQDLPPIPPFPGKNQELAKKVVRPETFPFPPFFPPNPLQPPPLFPPILQPPPLFPPLLPPNPLLPPPAPLIPLPPIPFFTPPPPPPLIPSLPPFVPLPPFPPFPFPPAPPIVPGVPPASTSQKSSPP